MASYNAEHEAYIKIRRALVQKKLLPGQPLSEEWLSQSLDMSRTPVRAALRRLASEGLVQLIPYKGATVTNPSFDDIKGLFEVREVLECYAAELCVPFVKDADILQLNNWVDAEREAYRTQNFEQVIDLNTKIHVLPAQITGNRYLLDAVTQLLIRGTCFMILKDPMVGKPFSDLKVIDEHQRIVEAFSAKDGLALSSSIREHLRTNAKFYTESTFPTIFE